MGKKLIPYGICFLLLSPCLILFFLSPHLVMPQKAEIFWALGNSFIQAFLSAFLTLILGFIVALGYIRIPPERFVVKSFFEVLCLITQFVPVIVSLVGILNLIQPFPTGIVGMVTVHAFLNFGLAAILLSQHMQTVWGETSDVARTLGVTRFLYWRKIGVPQIKNEIGLVFLYLFSMFFTSFSVPLIVGGGRGTTLEILIYEKMRLSSDWSAAVVLAWVQIIFIFILSFLVIKNKKTPVKRDHDMTWLGSYAGAALLLILMTGLFVGYSSGLTEGWIQRHELSTFGNDFAFGFMNSVILGLVTFILVIGVFKAIALVGILPYWLDRFLNGYLAPSTSLSCFAFLVILPAEHIWSYIKIPLAFTILSIPALYRMGFGERLKDLHAQIEHAQLLGATSYVTFRDITWPQIKSQARFLGALVATWACGDFAVSRILSTQDFTLGLIVQTLLSTYRMSLASLVSVLLLLACFVCFFLIMGWDYVDRRKSGN
jgi:thiamine transport system permease protein